MFICDQCKTINYLTYRSFFLIAIHIVWIFNTCYALFYFFTKSLPSGNVVFLLLIPLPFMSILLYPFYIRFSKAELVNVNKKAALPMFVAYLIGLFYLIALILLSSYIYSNQALILPNIGLQYFKIL